MSLENQNSDLALRIAWMLYQDVNTRFNVLIDECAHLQNTIFGYLRHTSLADVVPPGAPKSSRGSRGEREWFCAIERDEKYFQLSPQEASLRQLFSTLGAYAFSLEAGQQQPPEVFLVYIGLSIFLAQFQSRPH